jgi:hypothetical protein
MRAFMFVAVALVAAGPLANVASAETVLTSISGQFNRLVSEFIEFPEPSFGVHAGDSIEFGVDDAIDLLDNPRRFDEPRILDTFTSLSPEFDVSRFDAIHFSAHTWAGFGENGGEMSMPVAFAFTTGT